MLERAALVRSAREGRQQLYAFRPAPLADARRYLEDLSAQWDQAVERLRRLVEG